jgi:hypothetical protein
MTKSPPRRTGANPYATTYNEMTEIPSSIVEIPQANVASIDFAGRDDRSGLLGGSSLYG